MKEPIGGLYRIDADRKVTRVADGITLSNGLAWSPDNRTMYHCESRPGYVYAYDYDIDTGTPTNRRIHIDFASKGHHCDGCTVDAEGFLWIAEVNSEPALVVRAGQRLESIFVFSIEHDAVSAIRAVRNPDKLAHIDRQLTRH